MSQDSSGDRGGSGRPRLLFLCQTLPFPADGGVTLRTYNVLKILARRFDITALCFYRATERRNRAEVKSSIDQLSLLGRFEAFPIPQEHSRIRLLWDHLRSVLRRRAYTFFAYESPAFRARLGEVLTREHFDVVHVDSLDLVAYLPMLRGLPVVCVHHNIESQLLRRRAAAERSRLMKAYVSWQAHLTEQLEREWCDQLALNVVVSGSDCETLSRLSPLARMAVVPNGVDTHRFQPSTRDGEGVVFVGGLNGFANRDALEFFCQEVLPKLREGAHGPLVRFVGRASASLVERYRQEFNVDLTGYVDDVRPYVHAAACYVVPLRVGGGTRVKILDAWAMGKAIVSTSIGCEGLEAVDGENIFIRDTPEAFAAAVADVLSNQTVRRQLGEAGRRVAEQRYSWDVIGESMLLHYGECMKGQPRQTVSSQSGPASC